MKFSNNSPIFIACRPTGIIAILLAITVALLLSGDASATNLIVNGDFETGDFTGWTDQNHISITETSAYSGTYGCFHNCDDLPPGIDGDRIVGIIQTVDLTDVDNLEFYHSLTKHENVAAGALCVWLDADTEIWISSTGLHGYTYASVDVSSYTGSHNIQFGGKVWTGMPGPTYNLDYNYDDIIANAIPPVPSITSYSNSITNDESTTVNGEIDEDITFNVTANQAITTYNWYKDDVNQNNNNDELTASFSSGNHTLTASGTNANGTSNTITWNITNPNIININTRVTHADIPLTGIIVNDENSTGGFPNENGERYLTPNEKGSKEYIVYLLGNDLQNGFKLEVSASSSEVTKLTIDIEDLVASRNYDVYLDDQWIEKIGEVTEYQYDITSFSSHTLELVHATGEEEDGGGSGPVPPPDEDILPPTDEDEIIIEDDVITIGELTITKDEFDLLTIEQIEALNVSQDTKDKLIAIKSINVNWWLFILVISLTGLIVEGSHKKGHESIIIISFVGVVISAYKLGYF